MSMFCPKCGQADQTPETYCRQCGTFLPDLSKPVKVPVPPEQHLTANIVLSAMTIVVSFALAVLLWVVLAFKGDTHPLIYVTAGLLFAMGCWHVQTLWRSILLRRHIKRSRPRRAEDNAEPHPPPALEPAHLDDVVPPSITERTTNKLGTKLSQSK